MMPNKTKSSLLKYSATVAAISGVSVVNGQISYTDINPDLQIEGNFNSFNVDVNNDGIDDFEFLVIDTVFSGIQYGKLQVSGLNAGDDIIGFVTNGYSYASLLNLNDIIDDSSPVNNGGIMAEFPLFGASYPLWNGGVSDGYLGFKIEMNGSSHFGWMRLDVATNAKSAILKDFAFNLFGNGAISPGQTVGIEEDLNDLVQIFQSFDELILRFPGHLLNTQVDIFDINGHILESLVVNNTEIWVDWRSRKRGLYIIQMRNNGRLVSRKQLMR